MYLIYRFYTKKRQRVRINVPFIFFLAEKILTPYLLEEEQMLSIRPY